MIAFWYALISVLFYCIWSIRLNTLPKSFCNSCGDAPAIKWQAVLLDSRIWLRLTVATSLFWRAWTSPTHVRSVLNSIQERISSSSTTRSRTTPSSSISSHSAPQVQIISNKILFQTSNTQNTLRIKTITKSLKPQNDRLVCGTHKALLLSTWCLFSFLVVSLHKPVWLLVQHYLQDDSWRCCSDTPKLDSVS